MILTFASWNQVGEWLRRIEAIRQTAYGTYRVDMSDTVRPFARRGNPQALGDRLAIPSGQALD